MVEAGSYLFAVVILLVTIGVLGPFVFQGEGGSAYWLIIVSSAVVAGYGFLLRKAGGNLNKKKWWWLILLLLVPPSLLTVLGTVVLLDVALTIRKLSGVEQSRIDAAMRLLISSPPGGGTEKPPDIAQHLRGISRIWKILFVSVVAVTALLIVLPETTGNSLSSLFGVEVLSGDFVNLLRDAFYVDVVLFTVFALLYRRWQLGRMREQGYRYRLQDYRTMSIITQVIAVSFAVPGVLLFFLGLREEMFIFGPFSVVAMLYFQPREHDFLASTSVRQKIYRGFLVSVMIVFVGIMSISSSQMDSAGRCRTYLMLAAGNERSAQRAFLKRLGNSQKPYSSSARRLGEAIIHRLRLKTLNTPPEKQVEFFRLAIEVEEALGLGRELASDYHNIAAIYSALKDYQKAIEYHTMSAELYNKLNRKDRQADEIVSVGELYHFYLKDYEKAERAYLTALKYARDTDNLRARHGALTRLEWLYQKTGHACMNLSEINREKRMVTTRIIRKRLEALQKAEQDDDSTKRIKALRDLAGAYIISGDYASAVKCCKRALKMLDSFIFATESVKSKKAGTLLMLASAYTHQARYKQAEKAYQRALAIFKDIEDENGLERVAAGLKTLEMKRQNRKTEQTKTKQEKSPAVGHSYDRTWNYSIHPLGNVLLEVSDIVPQGTAVLRADRDYLKIRVRYSVSESLEVLIFVRASKMESDEVYSLADGCYGHPRGTGVVEKSIMFEGPQRLYEIVVTMLDRKTRKTLKEIYYPVDARWE